MTTITIKLGLSDEHKDILDERIHDIHENRDNFLTFEQFKVSLDRKNV